MLGNCEVVARSEGKVYNRDSENRSQQLKRGDDLVASEEWLYLRRSGGIPGISRQC